MSQTERLAAKRKKHATIELAVGLCTVAAVVMILYPGATARLMHFYHLVGPGSSAYRLCHDQLESTGDHRLEEIRMSESSEDVWTIFFYVTRPATDGMEERIDTVFCESDGKTTL